MNASAQPPCRQTEETTPGARVQERLARKRCHIEHRLERRHRGGYSLLREQLKKLRPVFPKSEAFSGVKFLLMSSHFMSGLSYPNLLNALVFDALTQFQSSIEN